MLEIIFGTTGEGAKIFGGVSYLIAFFILVFFVLMLYSQKTSGDNIIFFIMAYLLLTMFLGLFAIPVYIMTTVIVLIVLYISFYAYTIFNKGD